IFETDHPVGTILDVKNRCFDQLRKLLIGLSGNRPWFWISHQIPGCINCVNPKVDQSSAARASPIGKPTVNSSGCSARSHPLCFREIDLPEAPFPHCLTRSLYGA